MIAEVLYNVFFLSVAEPHSAGQWDDDVPVSPLGQGLKRKHLTIFLNSIYLHHAPHLVHGDPSVADLVEPEDVRVVLAGGDAAVPAD